jgi:hypothetical protein
MINHPHLDQQCCKRRRVEIPFTPKSVLLWNFSLNKWFYGVDNTLQRWANQLHSTNPFPAIKVGKSTPFYKPFPSHKDGQINPPLKMKGEISLKKLT